MKTTYIVLGAAALCCGLALATPNPGQLSPAPLDDAVSARAAALASIRTPAGGPAGPSTARATALGTLQSPDALSGPVQPRAGVLLGMRSAVSGGDSEPEVVASR